MIHTTINIPAYTRTRIIVALAISLFLFLGLLSGFYLNSLECRNIIPKNILCEAETAQNAAFICFWDILCAWLIAIPKHSLVGTAFACIVFFYRGAVIGNAFSVFFLNSLPPLALLLLIGYCFVTLMLMGLCMYLRAFEAPVRLIVRIILILIISGAAALLRLLPYLLFL